MNERRTTRSEDRDEALQLLLETMTVRAGGRGVALVDERGRLVAGAGRPREMWTFARIASTPDESTLGERAVRAHIEVGGEVLSLAAPWVAVREETLADTARSVARIFESTRAA